MVTPVTSPSFPLHHQVNKGNNVSSGLLKIYNLMNVPESAPDVVPYPLIEGHKVIIEWASLRCFHEALLSTMTIWIYPVYAIVVYEQPVGQLLLADKESVMVVNGYYCTIRQCAFEGVGRMAKRRSVWHIWATCSDCDLMRAPAQRSTTATQDSVRFS
jgi:hypothetical protein